VLIHGDRLICDDWVYQRKGGDFELVQSLEKKGLAVSSGTTLTKELLVLGHSNYSKVSLWRWHEG
jgi:hypothetical protein